MADHYQLDDRFLAGEGSVFLTGIQALARLPLEQLRADRRAGTSTAAFVSGYQGSPLGGYGDAVARAARLEPDLPVIFQPGLNEEYGATAVMGSQLTSTRPDCQYDGIVGIWYGKSPGSTAPPTRSATRSTPARRCRAERSRSSVMILPPRARRFRLLLQVSCSTCTCPCCTRAIRPRP